MTSLFYDVVNAVVGLLGLALSALTLGRVRVLPAAPYRVTAEFLDERDIALVVHGDDIPPETIEEVFGPVAAAGRLRLVRYTAGVSTTELIARARRAEA